MTPHELALAAADVIEKRGWCQRKLIKKPGGEVCALGAAYFAAGAVLVKHGQLLLSPESREEVKEFKRGFTRFLNESIPVWNDRVRRTKKEVIAKLREYGAEIGDPEKRRVLIPEVTPATPLTPDSPIWSEPAPEEPKRKVPVHEPA